MKGIHFYLKILFSILILSFSQAQATLYTYDELNRLTQVEYTSGQIIQYSYDAGGNLLSINNALPSGTAPKLNVTLSDDNVTAGQQIHIRLKVDGELDGIPQLQLHLPDGQTILLALQQDNGEWLASYLVPADLQGEIRYTLTAPYGNGHTTEHQNSFMVLANNTGGNPGNPGSGSLPLPNCERFAVYSIETHSLTLPDVDVPVYDAISESFTGEFLNVSTVLGFAGVNDRFKITDIQLQAEAQPNLLCHAIFDPLTLMLSIPVVEVPIFTVMGNLVFPVSTDFYSVILRYLPISNRFEADTLIHLQSQ